MIERSFRTQGGMLMIEVLVTILIVSLGMLGIAAMFVRSQQFNDEAYQHYQALDIAHQLSEQLSTNSTEATKFANSAYVTGATGGGVAGGSGFTRSAGACTSCNSAAMAKFDMTAFHDALVGAQKKNAAGNVSALIGALGCVEFLGVAGNTANPPRYRISVTWQGRQASADVDATINPTLCGSGVYAAGLRRVVSLEIQVL